MLIHAGGRGEHATAHIRHTHHLKKTLHRAVLAVRAMQHRQHRIDMPQRGQHVMYLRIGQAHKAGAKTGVGIAEMIRLTGKETVLASRGVENHRTGFRRDLHGRQLVAVQVPAARILTVDNPLAVLGDAHRNRLETFGIHSRQHAGRGDAGNRMFIRTPTIEHHNTFLGHNHPLTAERNF